MHSQKIRHSPIYRPGGVGVNRGKGLEVHMHLKTNLSGRNLFQTFSYCTEDELDLVEKRFQEMDKRGRPARQWRGSMVVCTNSKGWPWL